MAEEIELRHLRDKNGKKIAPFAPEAAIYDEKGMRLSDKLKGLNLNSIREAQDEALLAIDDKENEAIGNFSSQRVIPDMLSPEVMALIEASGGGTINNMPDGEDLTSKGIAGGKSVMQLADRPYNPSAFSGKGYTILRKNVSALSRGGNSNILTRDMISQPNTVYEVRYDFDLNGAEITVPEGCIIEFKSGSFKNGTLRGNNTIVKAPAYFIFSSISLRGSFLNEWYSEWFGASSKKVDNQLYLNYLIKELYNTDKGGVVILSDTYEISDTIYLYPKVSIKGISRINFYYTASPNTTNAAIIANFSDPNKWIIDSIKKDGSIYPYDELSIKAPESWAGERRAGIFLKDFDIYNKNGGYHINNFIFGGIRLRDLYNSEVSNISIAYTIFGISLSVGWNNTLSNIMTQILYCGLYLGWNATTNNVINYGVTGHNSLGFTTNTKGKLTFDTTLPPYVSLESCAFIMEGSDTDRCQAVFTACYAQYVDALCIGTKNTVLFQDIYLEGKFKTYIWTHNGYAKLLGTQNLTFKTESYEFGTQDGRIIAKGVRTCRCYDNSVENRNSVLKQYYLIEDNDELQTLYYDDFQIEDGQYKNLKRTPSKCINVGNKNYYLALQKPINEDEPYYSATLLNGYGCGNNGTTFAELVKRKEVNDVDIYPLYYIPFDTYDGEFVENRIFRFKYAGYEFASYLKINVPINVRNSRIESDIHFMHSDDNNDAAFNVYEHCTFVWQKNVYYTGSKTSYKLCGNKPIVLDIYLPNDNNLAYYGKLDRFVVNPDFEYPYVINIHYKDSIKTYKNKPSQGIPVGWEYYDTVNKKLLKYNGSIWVDEKGNPDGVKTKGPIADKPLGATGITEGFAYYCTNRQTVEGNRMGIMIYYAGADTWVDALGRVV